MKRASPYKIHQPWGRIAALLAACGATLFGVWQRCDPEVVLARAMISATILGAVTSLGAAAMQAILAADRDQQQTRRSATDN